MLKYFIGISELTVVQVFLFDCDGVLPSAPAVKAIEAPEIKGLMAS